MRKVAEQRFADKTLVKGFEGGVVYAAERTGKFYLVLDQGTMKGLLSKEDAAGIEFVKTYGFDMPDERNAYIAEWGWA